MDLPELLWPTTQSLTAFLMIVTGVLAAWPLGVAWAAIRSGEPERAAPRAAAVASGWALVVVATLVLTGSALARSPGPPPTVMLFVAVSNLLAAAVALSRVGLWLSHLPLAALIGFQGFRLPLELVLHEWAEAGTIPESMTWTGSNIDIVAGAVCLVAAVWLPWRGRGQRALGPADRAVAWLASGLGLALLLNVMRVAIGSAPAPIGWMGTEPPLLLPFHPPLSLIVPVCVSSALAWHLIALRALWSSRQAHD